MQLPHINNNTHRPTCVATAPNRPPAGCGLSGAPNSPPGVPAAAPSPPNKLVAGLAAGAPKPPNPGVVAVGAEGGGRQGHSAHLTM